jgi:hypothetical protein
VAGFWRKLRRILALDLFAGRDRRSAHIVRFGDPPVPAWRLSPAPDFTVLFRALSHLTLDEATLHIEDGFRDANVRRSLGDRSIPGRLPVPRGTLFSLTLGPWITLGRAEDVHLPATASNLADLADMSQRYNPSEIGFHIHVARGDRVLLTWCDADTGGAMFVSKEIPEEEVRAFAAALATDYGEQETCGR